MAVDIRTFKLKHIDENALKVFSFLAWEFVLAYAGQKLSNLPFIFSLCHHSWAKTFKPSLSFYTQSLLPPSFLKVQHRDLITKITKPLEDLEEAANTLNDRHVAGLEVATA